MPSSVGSDLARKFEAMARETRQAQQRAVRDAALAVTTEVRQSIARDAPGGKVAGGKVGARFDMRGDEAVVKATGKGFHLLERPTKAHTIQPKKRGRGAGKKAISFGGIARASAQHRGTRGKRTFERGVEAGRAKAGRKMAEAMTEAAKRGMRA